MNDLFELIQKMLDPITMEQEFEIEKHLIYCRETASREELIKHIESLERQNIVQGKFISNAVEQIAKYQARVITLEKPVKQPKKTILARLCTLINHHHR